MAEEHTRECDVLVIGCGGAGAMAAITAAELDARVLVVERSDDGGGSTRMAGGNLTSFLDIDRSILHYTLLTQGRTATDVVEAYVKTAATLPDWFSAHGGKQVEPNPHPGWVGAHPHQGQTSQVYPAASNHSVFDQYDGADGLGSRYRVVPANWVHGSGPDAAGTTLWQVLAANLSDLKVPVLYSTRALRLTRDPSTGRISGAICTSKSGEIVVRATRGVILACGGFEDDKDLKMDYFGADLPTLCAPGRRTGDGIRMAQAVGAQLHHMNALAATYGYKFPEEEAAFIARICSPGFIFVDNEGHRYADESALDQHLLGLLATTPDPQTGRYTRLPSFLIFDEETRYDGPIVRVNSGYNAGFDWSRDNSREIKRGWIKAAASIDELANTLGISAPALADTVQMYNAACDGSASDSFGRPREMMRALASPPYYGVEVWPCLFNTQGGPKRNNKCEVIDAFGDPIPGLYSAGELGSMWSVLYRGAGNITEALATGIIAGRAAANA